MDGVCKMNACWIRFVSVFSLFCQHFRASTTQNDLRATIAPRVLSSCKVCLLWRRRYLVIRKIEKQTLVVKIFCDEQRAILSFLIRPGHAHLTSIRESTSDHQTANTETGRNWISP